MQKNQQPQRDIQLSPLATTPKQLAEQHERLAKQRRQRGQQRERVRELQIKLARQRAQS